MLRRQLERYGRWLFAIAALVALAIVCGGYILVNQRLRLPFEDTYPVRVEIVRVPGLEPGLGQPANVSGVHVGSVSDVELVDGRAIVEVEIERDKLPTIWQDAHATLVPNSPLKDLQIEIDPGGPDAPELEEGGLIPSARTSAPIDSDELTNALDADTRQFFQALVGGVDRGTRDRGEDLRALFASLGPTAESIGTVTGALADRRRQLRRLVGNLAILTREVGERDQEVARVVSAGADTVQALAAEERALRASVSKLPGTLATTRRALDSVTAFSEEVVPAAKALRPAARAAKPALDAAGPLSREATPILRDRIRPLVRELQPVAEDLGPATRDLSAVTPSLATTFIALNYVVNEAAYNPPGDEEGYLFWLAWFAHNSASFLSTQDAHGVAWRGLGLFSCEQLSDNPTLTPILGAVLGVVPGCD